MNKRCIGMICQIGGVVIALLGLIPAALLLNPWRKAETAPQMDEVYFGANLLKMALVALVGVAAGYVLHRFGSSLKAKSKKEAP